MRVNVLGTMKCSFKTGLTESVTPEFHTFGNIGTTKCSFEIGSIEPVAFEFGIFKGWNYER